jgi:serine/threonine protein kinase
MEELIGKTLGQYEIREKIGEGGMAYVFKAYQPSLNRFVAVKVLSPTTAEKKGFTERFQREAHSVARLHHPHILPVHDFGVQGSYNYIVMHYVEHSTTLGELIAAGRPLEKLIDYIVQVADALNYAHEEGIIHRDVKPSNILIDRRWALLSDFGLVKMSEQATQLTGTGLSLGTPAYMSPEQVEGIHVDHRTDIYALGIILYKILTGTIPHDAPTPIGILIKRRTEPVPAPRQLKPGISKSLEQVTLRSLAMKPDKRYSSATDFAEALKKAQADPNYREKLNGASHPKENQTLVDDSTLPHPRLAAPRQRRGLLVGGGIAALLLIGAVVWALFLPRGSSDNPTVQPTSQLTASANANASATVAATDTPLPATSTPTPIPPSISLAVAQTKLEIRSGPGDVYDLLGYLPAGTTSEITGRDETEEWWQIRTGLATTGVGWIKAGINFSQATNAENMPIALSPPTPTAIATLVPATSTPTATSTSTPPTATVTVTQATATALSKAPATPTATPTPPAPTGRFTLLEPTLDDTSTGPTEFEWRWDGPVGSDQGFEVRVWREGEPPAGVHNAVEDNKNGHVAAVGNNIYRVTINIRDAVGVRGRGGEYLWTIVLVQISPDYKDLGIQAPPGRLSLGLGGGGGGDGGSDSGSGSVK